MKQKIYTPVDEQETVITFMRNDTDVSVFTSDPTMVTKLDKIFKRSKEHLIRGKLAGVEYLIPKNCLSFRKPVTRSEEFKKQKSEQMKILNQKS